MAHDTLTLNITLTTTGEEYEGTPEAWYEHYHNNATYKQDVIAAVQELLENTLANVMVNGVGQDLSDIYVNLDSVEVHLNDEEQAAYDASLKDEQERWDAFHHEIDLRTARDGVNGGVYSMGDLSGPISQLDEVRHTGPARVVITDGWGDDGPMVSDSIYNNPTNWDMFRLFSEALAKSADQHHVFLEGVKYLHTGPDGVANYQAITGS